MNNLNSLNTTLNIPPLPKTEGELMNQWDYLIDDAVNESGAALLQNHLDQLNILKQLRDIDAYRPGYYAERVDNAITSLKETKEAYANLNIEELL